MALEHFGAGLQPSDLEVKLAALVAAAEREACAKVCDGYAKYGVPAVAACAADIRARSEQEQPR